MATNVAKIQKQYDVLVGAGLATKATLPKKDPAAAARAFIEVMEGLSAQASDPENAIRKSKKKKDAFNGSVELYEALTEEYPPEGADEAPNDADEAPDDADEAPVDEAPVDDVEEAPKTTGKRKPAASAASGTGTGSGRGGVKRAAPTGQPGITETVTALLKKASKTKPITKDEIHAALVKTFPDRNADPMKNTIGLQISKLRRDGQAVQSNDKTPKGYWL